MNNKQTLEVWSILEDPKDQEKSYWKHIGRAWENRDGSLNLKLDALPLGRQLQVRKAKPQEDRN